MLVSIIMECPPFLGGTFITLNGGKVRQKNASIICKQISIFFSSILPMNSAFLSYTSSSHQPMLLLMSAWNTLLAIRYDSMMKTTMTIEIASAICGSASAEYTNAR